VEDRGRGREGKISGGRVEERVAQALFGTEPDI